MGPVGAVAAVPGAAPSAAYGRLNDDGPQEEDGGRGRRGRTLSSASVETSGDLTVAVAFERVTYAVPWDPTTQDVDAAADGAVAGASSASVATTAQSNVGGDADERKLILSNVSGVVHPGECCAILGSSGSGKTSLLDVLAGVTPDGPLLQGTVRFNGRANTAFERRMQSAYVMQDDHLLPSLTVRQTFWYAAALRIGRQLSQDELHARVDAVIGELGLRNVANSAIGGFFTRGISGGERRRVTIGIHLLSNPSVLLLDEPTSGLDAFNANALVQTLSALAMRRRKTVIFTIHQPRSDIFALLERVMLLSSGRCVYFGAADMLVAHLAECGFPCARFVNPLDHAIDTVVVDKRTVASEQATTARLDRLVAAYERSPQHAALETELESAAAIAGKLGAAPLPWTRHPQRWHYTFSTVLGRQWVNLGRNPIALAMRLGQAFAFACILSLFILRLDNNQAGLAFYKLKKSKSSVQNRTGLIYQSLLCNSFIAMLTSISLFPEHRDLFYRERRQQLYSAGTLLTAYMVHILPAAIVAELLYCYIVYYATGLFPDQVRFWIFTSSCIASYIFGELVGIFFLSLFYSITIANSLSALFLTVAALMASGFFRSYDRMPEFVQYISYASIYKYSTEILIANEFHELTLTCDPDEPCRYPSGDVYLAFFFPDALDNMVRNGILTVAFVVAFFVASWLALEFRRRSLR